MTENKKPRLIAYYLPQYHPIPENDEWWGEGFTEWTNVRKAKPLFRRHDQPRIPADLGYYDLRNPEVREAQAQLAREAGIEGFCYWHYWFAGRRLLERPFDEVLQSGRPDYPFCLGWANASWTGTWYGAADRILVEQTYPGAHDHTAHFNALLPAFRDQRYIKVDGKPLFLVFQPSDIDRQTIDLWQELALSCNLPGLFFTGVVKNDQEAETIRRNGFNAATISRTNGRGTSLPILQRCFTFLFGHKKAPAMYARLLNKPFHVYQGEHLLPYIDMEDLPGFDFYPCVMPGWDNTPRAGLNGHLWTGTSPKLFGQHLRKAVERIRDLQPEHQIIIIKSWNEWAEGNYLEPDRRFGHGYLQAIREVIDEL